MFSFEGNAEFVMEEPKKFIEAFLRKFVRVHAGSGGVQLGRYIVAIKDPGIKQSFLTAVDDLMNEPGEDWIVRELEFTKRVLKTWKKEPVTARSAASAG
jgi:hypothetical protein